MGEDKKERMGVEGGEGPAPESQENAPLEGTL